MCSYSLDKRTFVLVITVATTCSSVQADERPNIVLLMGDDHGWDKVVYNGHSHLKTSVLDEMATQGLRLDRFYSAHPSCHREIVKMETSSEVFKLRKI